MRTFPDNFDSMGVDDKRRLVEPHLKSGQPLSYEDMLLVVNEMIRPYSDGTYMGVVFRAVRQYIIEKERLRPEEMYDEVLKNNTQV